MRPLQRLGAAGCGIGCALLGCCLMDFERVEPILVHEVLVLGISHRDAEASKLRFCADSASGRRVGPMQSLEDSCAGNAVRCVKLVGKKVWAAVLYAALDRGCFCRKLR